jgi:hypothetical protein
MQGLTSFIKEYCREDYLGYYPEALQSCIQGIYNLLVALAVLVAFLYFLFGAIQYMLSPIADIKGSGKSKMFGALKGLFVIFIFGAILYWINPNIFNAKLIFYRVTSLEIPETEVWTDEQAKSYAYNISGTIGETISWGPDAIVKVPTSYSNIKILGNDVYNGQHGEFVNKCMIPALDALNAKLKEKDKFITLNDGYSVGDHQSKAHTVCGTAIDITPNLNRKDYWEAVCSAIVETGYFHKIIYEAGPWDSINCGGTTLKRMVFQKTTGPHFHIEDCSGNCQ